MYCTKHLSPSAVFTLQLSVCSKCRFSTKYTIYPSLPRCFLEQDWSSVNRISSWARSCPMAGAVGKKNAFPIYHLSSEFFIPFRKVSFRRLPYWLSNHLFCTWFPQCSLFRTSLAVSTLAELSMSFIIWRMWVFCLLSWSVFDEYLVFLTIAVQTHFHRFIGNHFCWWL